MIAPPSTSPLASAVTLATVLPSISAGSGTPASTGVQATGAAVPPVQTPSQHLSQAASSVPSEGRSMAGSAGVPAGPAGPAPGFSQATSAQLQPQSQTPRQEQQQQQNFAAAVQQLNGKNSCTILHSGTVATDKLLCLKNVGSQISIFLPQMNNWHPWQLKKQNQGGLFGAANS